MATNTCCPKGYIYIDSTGHYSDPDPAIGSGMITNTPPDPFFNTCATFANRNAMGVWVIPSDTPPIPCSCCPPNFVYSAYVGMCYSAISSSATLPVLPVPCINCNCITP